MNHSEEGWLGSWLRVPSDTNTPQKLSGQIPKSHHRPFNITFGHSAKALERSFHGHTTVQVETSPNHNIHQKAYLIIKLTVTPLHLETFLPLTGRGQYSQHPQRDTGRLKSRPPFEQLLPKCPGDSPSKKAVKGSSQTGTDFCQSPYLSWLQEGAHQGLTYNTASWPRTVSRKETKRCPGALSTLAQQSCTELYLGNKMVKFPEKEMLC